MQIKDLMLRYSHYNKWANELLLNVILKNVSEESLDKNIVSSFSSLRKTIYHIWDAEYIWHVRLNGQSPSTGPGKSFNGKFSDAVKAILEQDQQFINYIGQFDEEIMEEAFTYQNIEGKTFSNARYESIHHCMNHSTYHRGQIVTMLRQLGVTDIPSTDYVTFIRIKTT